MKFHVGKLTCCLCVVLIVCLNMVICAAEEKVIFLEGDLI